MKYKIRPQIHLNSKRAKIIRFLQSEGYNGAEIGIIFFTDRFKIKYLLKKEAEYKKQVKNLLKD